MIPARLVRLIVRLRRSVRAAQDPEKANVERKLQRLEEQLRQGNVAPIDGSWQAGPS